MGIRRAFPLLAAVVAIAAAFAGAYAAASEDDAGARTTLTGGTWNRLGSGVSIGVPRGWDGRVLFRDPSGLGPIYQVANFELPPNEGFEPPAELPPGEEDPILAMGAGHVLVTAISGGTNGTPAPRRLGFDNLRLLPYTAPRVPRDHALAEGTFCFEHTWQCLEIEVDFGGRPPAPDLVARVDDVLSSIQYGSTRSP